MTRRDLNVFSLAAGSAALIGLALGAWASPPANLGGSVAAAEPDATERVDPNLARYRQMIANEGVDPAPHVVVAGFYPAPEPARRQHDVVPAVEMQPVDDDALGEPNQLDEARWDGPSRPATPRAYAEDVTSAEAEPLQGPSSDTYVAVRPAAAAWNAPDREEPSWRAGAQVRIPAPAPVRASDLPGYGPRNW